MRVSAALCTEADYHLFNIAFFADLSAGNGYVVNEYGRDAAAVRAEYIGKYLIAYHNSFALFYREHIKSFVITRYRGLVCLAEIKSVDVFDESFYTRFVVVCKQQGPESDRVKLAEQFF